MDSAEEITKYDLLKGNGFSDQEIDNWRSEREPILRQNGFTDNEINSYFGNSPPKNPDMSNAVKALKQTITEAKGDKKEASSWMDDFLTGWQGSTMGLITREKSPDLVLPEHADRAARILMMAGQTVGDIPAMLPGMISTPLVGPVAGTAAAFALPAALRKVLVDHYEKGDVKDFKDFYERASGAFLQATKQGMVGALTAATGGAVGAVTGGLSPIAQSLTVNASELAAMTTAGAAMEGHIPTANDFIDSAILLGGFKAAGAIKSKLFKTYSETGMKPSEVYEASAQDPVVRQEVLSDDPVVPQSIQKTDLGVKINSELNSRVDGISDEHEPSTLQVEKLPEKFNPQKEGSPVEYSDSVNKILSRIGESPETPKEKLTWDKLYYNVLDANDPLKLMTQELLGKEALGKRTDPYGLARAFGGTSRKADLIIEKGPRDFETTEKTGTPGLSEIWEKAEDLGELRAYQMSKHALDLSKEGIETGFDIEAAKKVVKELEPKYKDIAKESVKFNNDNIDYLVDSGVLAKDKADIMKTKWQNYSAMNRVLDTEAPSGTSPGLNVTNPIKSIKGSEREIIDPLESNIRNTHKVIAAAEKNRVMTAITDLIDQANENGNSFWGKRSKISTKSIELNTVELSNILKEQGFDPKDASHLEDLATVFRADKTPLADDQIASFKDGKRIVYEGVPEDLVKVVRGLDVTSANLLTKILSPPSKALRVGMLNSPAFAIRHFFRQEVLATALSKDLHIPLVETVKGLTNMLGPEFEDWIMHGGGSETITSIDKDYIKSKIYDLNEKTGFLENSWNQVKDKVQFIKMGIELTDEARTFQKYLNRQKAGLDPWQASFDARDTGIDVSRSGAKMQAYMALDPFQGIKIQGLDLIGRRVSENPYQVLPRLFATITLPSLLLWWHNHDKDWYKNLTTQDRDTNWHFSVGDPDKDGHVFRLPKPFEPGVVFGALPERLMDKFFTDNPNAFGEFSKTIKESVTPGYVPTFAQPVIEQYANKSFLTDSPLIPHNLEGVKPGYQSKTYTSDTGKIIASVLRQIPLDLFQKPGSLGSPAIIDNYIHNWTGGVGQLAVSAIDTALEKTGLADKMGVDYNHTPPESVWSDNPFLRSFVLKYPSTNTKEVETFFNRYQDSSTAQKTISVLRGQLDFSNMEKELKLSAADGTLVKLEGFKSSISEQMALIQKITVLPGMDKHEKRQSIDALAQSVNATAKQGNLYLDQIEKVIKENK